MKGTAGELLNSIRNVNRNTIRIAINGQELKYVRKTQTNLS